MARGRSEERELPPFSRKLKELREAAGLSQKALAEATGLHPMALAKLEQGKRGPSWETIQALAKALGVTCMEFTEEALTAESKAAGRRRKPSK
jgi:transcriptional regulator with XRE-family HTH domain